MNYLKCTIVTFIWHVREFEPGRLKNFPNMLGKFFNLQSLSFVRSFLFDGCKRFLLRAQQYGVIICMLEEPRKYLSSIRLLSSCCADILLMNAMRSASAFSETMASSTEFVFFLLRVNQDHQ